MSFSSAEAQPMEGTYGNTDYAGAQQPRQFELTPEELRIIRECSREGIFKRAIPLGIFFGIGGLLGAKAGPLMHSKWGVKPAVIGLGMIGYGIGRMSYSKVCLHRALQVPDGTLRKIYPNAVKDNEFLEPSQNFYSSTETLKSKDKPWANKSSSSDIDDLPTMSNLDTTPSEYYKVPDEYKDENKDVRNYTSYDDLRKQNRQEYTTRVYGVDPQRSPPRYQRPQENPNVRRPSQDPQYLDGGGGQKTKYGDSWE